MILADWQIRSLAVGGMVRPFQEELVNPASLDVTLASVVMIETVESPELVRFDMSGFSQEKPFELRPGEFILAATECAFALPDNIAAEFRLKSSRAREGLDQALAVWCDPGWGLSKPSALTLELRNNRQLHSIPLWPGMRIGQMVFHKMAERPVVNYSISGRYNGDLEVTASKGH